jgi:signal transduction histidine kinase
MHDPADVLNAALSDVSSNGIRVDTSTAPGTWRMDETRLRHALANILQNAQQASPAGKPAIARVSAESGSLVYEVRDFGAGLPANAAERIFDPFYTTRTNGTGLGLAVARRAAELHGGRVTAENHPDGGAVFRIVLPQQNG